MGSTCSCSSKNTKIVSEPRKIVNKRNIDLRHRSSLCKSGSLELASQADIRRLINKHRSKILSMTPQNKLKGGMKANKPMEGVSDLRSGSSKKSSGSDDEASSKNSMKKQVNSSSNVSRSKDRLPQISNRRNIVERLTIFIRKNKTKLIHRLSFGPEILNTNSEKMPSLEKYSKPSLPVIKSVQGPNSLVQKSSSLNQKSVISINKNLSQNDSTRNSNQPKSRFAKKNEARKKSVFNIVHMASLPVQNSHDRGGLMVNSMGFGNVMRKSNASRIGLLREIELRRQGKSRTNSVQISELVEDASMKARINYGNNPNFDSGRNLEKSPSKFQGFQNENQESKSIIHNLDTIQRVNSLPKKPRRSIVIRMPPNKFSIQPKIANLNSLSNSREMSNNSKRLNQRNFMKLKSKYDNSPSISSDSSSMSIESETDSGLKIRFAQARNSISIENSMKNRKGNSSVSILSGKSKKKSRVDFLPLGRVTRNTARLKSMIPVSRTNLLESKFPRAESSFSNSDSSSSMEMNRERIDSMDFTKNHNPPQQKELGAVNELRKNFNYSRAKRSGHRPTVANLNNLNIPMFQRNFQKSMKIEKPRSSVVQYGPPSLFKRKKKKNSNSGETKFQEKGDVMGGYKYIRLLGEGSFGKVMKAESLLDQKEYAVKQINKRKLIKIFKRKYRSKTEAQEIMNTTIMNEVNILRKLSHKNIIKFKDKIDFGKSKNVYIITEFVDGGPLLSKRFWKTYKRQFKMSNLQITRDPEYQNINPNSRFCPKKMRTEHVKLLFRQLVDGIKYIHNEKNIIHNDIKPDNILINEQFEVKICDFGVSEDKSDTGGTSGRKKKQNWSGTKMYCPPEAFTKDEVCDIGKDIWAIGVILYEMMFGVKPFFAGKEKKLKDVVISTEPNYPDDLEQDLLDLLKGMLQKNVSKRWSILQIENSLWLSRD